jgi:chaperonin GroES
MKQTLRIEPLQDKVVVKPLSEEKVTASGIVIPDTVDREKPMQGEVVAVGPGRLKRDGTRNPMSVKVGDVVLFTKYAPDEVEIDDEEYLVIEEEKILAKIRKK